MEISNNQGMKVISFKEKSEARMSYFKPLFSEVEGCSIQEILQVLKLFPKSIKDEMNDSLTSEVTEEKLCSIVHSFQMGKSPDPDGFSVEFSWHSMI